MKPFKCFFVLLLVTFFVICNLPSSAANLEKPAGRIVSLSGTVKVSKGGTITNAKPFQNLDTGDVVVTGANSRVAILLRDESLIKLNSNSFPSFSTFKSYLLSSLTV